MVVEVMTIHLTNLDLYLSCVVDGIAVSGLLLEIFCTIGKLHKKNPSFDHIPKTREYDLRNKTSPCKSVYITLHSFFIFIFKKKTKKQNQEVNQIKVKVRSKLVNVLLELKEANLQAKRE